VAIRVAVLVPGIMGSRLFYGSGANSQEIWGENFAANYRRIINQPTSLQWNGIPADSEPLRYVYASERAGLRRFPKFRLWERLLKFLEGHEEFGNPRQVWEYSYDWRQSLLVTAQTLGRDLDEYTEALATERGIPPNDISYVFLTHSMGGLVVRIAVALGVLAPSAIDRIVHIGSPLDGSVHAFRSAYRGGSLPLLQTFYRVFKGKKNAQAFHDSFLRSVKSFPSVYQLMPPKANDYLVYTPHDKRNPLSGSIIDATMRRHATVAHRELVRANLMLEQGSIRVFTVYSDYHSKRTDTEYQVQELGDPDPGYLIKDPMPCQSTEKGDGTVSMWSAMGTDPPCLRLRVTNVDHAVMCHDRGVVGQLMQVL
jgi:hypothetical protein